MPVDVLSLATDEPDVAHETLNAVFSPTRPIQFSGSRDDFEFRLRSASVDGFGADFLRHTMRARASTDPLDAFLVGTVVSGSIAFSARGEHVALRRGGIVNYQGDAPLRAEWDDVTFAIVRIPVDAVRSTAETFAGVPRGALRFHGLTPVSPLAAQQWRMLSGFVHRSVLGGESDLDNALVRAPLVQLIATTALGVFPNTAMAIAHPPPTGSATPAAVRRAVAFVDENAHEAITVADIAAAAGISGRAVQAAFRKHHGTTPTGYLRRARLAGVHRDLQVADPSTGATVAGVAATWGFTRATRFAAFYREQYGVAPSTTLRG